MQLQNKLNDITKKNDKYSLSSSDNLKRLLEYKIKKVFIGSLKCIEIKFGTNFDGFEQIRKEILRLGNDAIRDLHNSIDSSFNIEQVPDVLTVRFLSKGNDNGEKNEKCCD